MTMLKNLIITLFGKKKLEKELIQLGDERKNVVEDLQAAKAEGDLSENAGYDDARARLETITGRIEEINAILKSAKVITKKSNSGKVDVGSSVTVELKGNTYEYEIVGKDEADPVNGKISYESPIGAALMGAKKGDKVCAAAPSGEIEYLVLNIQ